MHCAHFLCLLLCHRNGLLDSPTNEYFTLRNTQHQQSVLETRGRPKTQHLCRVKTVKYQRAFILPRNVRRRTRIEAATGVNLPPTLSLLLLFGRACAERCRRCSRKQTVNSKPGKSIIRALSPTLLPHYYDWRACFC